MSGMLRALVLCWLCGAVACVRAQSPDPAAATTILFVGNSFTYGGGTKVLKYNAGSVTDETPGQKDVGGIPAIFKKFADEAPLKYEVHVETVGGRDLEFYYQNARDLLAQGKWDVVVLQGFSTEALPVERGGKPENFVRSAAALEGLIHQANPATRIYLYETWAYPLKTYPEDPTDPLASRRAMSKDLQTGYESAFTTVGRFAAVAPVGDAYMKLAASKKRFFSGGQGRADKPIVIDLLDTDRKHPSVQGSYLSALVLFQTITDCDVTGLWDDKAAYDLGILDEAAVLQQLASETVRTIHYTSQGMKTTPGALPDLF